MQIEFCECIDSGKSSYTQPSTERYSKTAFSVWEKLNYLEPNRYLYKSQFHFLEDYITKEIALINNKGSI